MGNGFCVDSSQAENRHAAHAYNGNICKKYKSTKDWLMNEKRIKSNSKRNKKIGEPIDTAKNASLWMKGDMFLR